jgi:hypothetical protein
MNCSKPEAGASPVTGQRLQFIMRIIAYEKIEECIYIFKLCHSITMGSNPYLPGIVTRIHDALIIEDVYVRVAMRIERLIHDSDWRTGFIGYVLF